MKNIVISFTVILLITILSSCKKDESVPQDYFGFETYEEAFANLGVHVHFFDVVNGGISVKATNQMSQHINWRLTTMFRNNPLANDLGDGGIYYINDNKFIYNSETGYTLDGGDRMDSESTEAFAATMYGQNNTFRLERDGEDIFSIEYYIPELIEVSGIQGNVLEIDKNSNLNLTWNADSNNEHGVVIYLSWNGLNMSDNSASQQVKRGIVVDDTGSTIINSSFFKDIPVGANFSLYVIRGNAERKDTADNRSYTVNSHTMHRLSYQIVE